MPRYCPHAPHPKQLEFLRITAFDCGYGGGAGGGKSDALLMAGLQGVHVPGYSGLIIRRTFAELSLPDAIMARSHEWLADTDAHWDGLAKQWRFPSGATLGFGYCDGSRDHLRYQGAALQYLGIDEATQLPGHQIAYLFGRIRGKTGFPQSFPLRGRTAFNPGGLSHRYIGDRYGIPAKYSGETICKRDSAGEHWFVPSLLADNPSLDADQYRRSLAQLDAVTRAQMELGAWVQDDSGLVYGDPDKTVRVTSLPSGQWEHHIGIDYGFVDQTAFAVWAVDRSREEMYLTECYAIESADPTAAAEETQRLVTRYRPAGIVGDVGGLGKGYAEEARRRWGIPVEPADKRDKLGYMRLLRGALEHGLARVVAPGCSQWLEQSSELRWADGRQREEHPSCANHCTDAALYGWRQAKHYQAEAPEPELPPDEVYLQAADARRLEGLRDPWLAGLS